MYVELIQHISFYLETLHHYNNFFGRVFLLENQVMVIQIQKALNDLD